MPSFRRSVPRPVAWLVALATIAMVLTTLLCWVRHGAAAFAAILVDHPAIRIIFTLVFVAAVAAGAVLPLYHFLEHVDTALTIAGGA